MWFTYESMPRGRGLIRHIARVLGQPQGHTCIINGQRRHATQELAHTEALRILLGAVGHLALFPAKVDEWVSDVTWKGTSLPTECVFYTYKDADGLLWYSNADDDGDYFSDAVRKGWVRHKYAAGNYWRYNEALSKWFRERAGVA